MAFFRVSDTSESPLTGGRIAGGFADGAIAETVSVEPSSGAADFGAAVVASDVAASNEAAACLARLTKALDAVVVTRLTREQTASLDDADLLAALRFSRDAARAIEGDLALLAVEVDRRSSRAFGQSGLAARNGAVNGAALVRSITGTTLTEAFRRIRSGALIEMAENGPIPGAPDAETGSTSERDGDGRGDDGGDGDGDRVSADDPPWKVRSPFLPIASALGRGAIDSTGAAAVLRILEPVQSEVAPEVFSEAIGALAIDAPALDADELAHRARLLRDTLDRDGVADRERLLWGRRSLRFGRAVDGMLPVHGLLPPESAVIIKGALDQAMSPKLGGPRFVDSRRVAVAAQIEADPRTPEQYRHDVLVDVFAFAKARDDGHLFLATQPAVTVQVTLEDLARSEGAARRPDGGGEVVGDRQATRRNDDTDVSRTRANGGRGPRPSGDGRALGVGDGIAAIVETDEPVSAETAHRILCDTGLTAALVDDTGNPLKIGGNARLFNRRQRRALDIRDGGCLFPRCDRPPSWTEAHHIEPWSRTKNTHVDNGMLLCRYHHRLVHHRGWDVIVAAESGIDGVRFSIRPPVVLDPDRMPIPMPTKSPPWLRRPAQPETAEERVTVPPPE